MLNLKKNYGFSIDKSNFKNFLYLSTLSLPVKIIRLKSTEFNFKKFLNGWISSAVNVSKFSYN